MLPRIAVLIMGGPEPIPRTSANVSFTQKAVREERPPSEDREEQGADHKPQESWRGPQRPLCLAPSFYTRTSHTRMHMLTHVHRHVGTHLCVCICVHTCTPVRAARGGAGTGHPQSSVRRTPLSSVPTQGVANPVSGHDFGVSQLSAREGKGCQDQTHVSPVISLHSAHTLSWRALISLRILQETASWESHAPVMMKGLEVPRIWFDPNPR